MAKAKTTNFGRRVGILGGGQLARLLILQGHRLGLQMHVLCPSLSEPAAQVTPHVHIGTADHAGDLAKFFRAVDVVTIESEFHFAPLLEKVAAETLVDLFPRPALLGELQDRLPQKELLQKFKIPTADFIRVDSVDDLGLAVKKFPKGFVLKKRFGGYDGYGTFIIRSKKDLQTLKLDFKESPCVAEAFVPFRRELAVVLARNLQGEMAVLPVVETHQVDRRLDWLQGPIKHPETAPLIKNLKKFLDSIDFVGAIAFEMFDTGRELVINEIAPRVHNSAHYSLEALQEDQFTLHLKAVLGDSLTSPKLRGKKFSMVNLIGGGALKAAAPENLTGALHWYGKSESRKGRKMGHVTYVDQGVTTALKERKGFQL